MRESVEHRIGCILEHTSCGLDATVHCRIARTFILQAAGLSLSFIHYAFNNGPYFIKIAQGISALGASAIVFQRNVHVLGGLPSSTERDHAPGTLVGDS